MVSNTSTINKRNLDKLFSAMNTESITSIYKKIGHFSENQIHLTELDFENITELQNILTSMRSNENRTVLEAIFIFLVKL